MSAIFALYCFFPQTGQQLTRGRQHTNFSWSLGSLLYSTTIDLPLPFHTNLPVASELFRYVYAWLLWRGLQDVDIVVNKLMAYISCVPSMFQSRRLHHYSLPEERKSSRVSCCEYIRCLSASSLFVCMSVRMAACV